jgi:hypothetical protein
MSLERTRVLLLHTADDPEIGPWNDGRWDRVVDLGVAGEQTRQRWTKTFGCSVEPLPEFEMADFAVVRRALASGFGCVVDEHGLDWWELISIRFHEQIALIVRLKKLAAQFSTTDEVFVTRPGFHAKVLDLLLEGHVECFRDPARYFGRARRLVEIALNFNFPQLLQILGDKYDAGYRMRSWLAHAQARCEDAMVLLPVAQGNAARTALSYAEVIPDRKFLLVTTRSSGWVAETPKNVAQAKLASYAGIKSGQDCGKELLDLLKCWRELRFEGHSEIGLLERTGAFSGITKILRDGLAIRDAWLEVFRRERVSAVLCTDDTNPYTHMPLLIAQKRGLPTLACHHGALDGGHLVKRSHADLVLAKGHMEKDYLVSTCGLAEERVEIGAPSLRQGINVREGLNKGVRHRNDSIVFFSEPYALDGGRCQEFYSELLPPLVDLASRMNLDLVVKLHPMESERERRKLVNAALLARQVERVQVVAGVLSEELLDRTSFALTVQSTAAVDCAIRGIPVFLCKWLDYSYYGYVDQFIRYGAGVPLRSPADIAKIPDMLEKFPAPARTDFWQTISGENLERLLTGALKMAVAV